METIIAAQLAPSVNLEFSKREIKVLDLICKGYSDLEISRTLYLSLRVISEVETSLLEKAELSSRIGLVRWAVQEGHVQLPEQ